MAPSSQHDTSDNVIKTTRNGAVFEVVLDRPKANAIDLVTSRKMGEVFKESVELKSKI